MSPTSPEFESKLKIGAVARLTGVSVHTLRKWEERYGAVSPQRTDRGGRLYSREDVRRLVLIRHLTQAGTPLREVARASVEQLERAVNALADAPVPVARKLDNVRIAVVGDALPTLLAHAGTATSALELVGAGPSVDVVADAVGGEGVDLLLLEQATVHLRAADAVRSAMHACGTRGAVVVYGFGSAPALDALRRIGVALLRAPVDPGALQRVVLGLMQELGAEVVADLGPVRGAAPPRYSAAVIGRVSRISTSVRCECPRHLADLLLSLSAFERYSAECESENPSDAALHHYLWQTTGRCRAMLEDALDRIAEAEGIDLDDPG